MPTGVRLTVVRLRCLLVQIPPPVQCRQLGEPDETRVVGVSGRHNSARFAYAPHLPQRRHGICDVLKYLMSVHDVEGGDGEFQRVHIRRRERDIR